jgi:glutathione peroxidase
MSTPIEQIPVKLNDGSESSLGAYSGKVRLVVNVASKCGFTPQYSGLEALYRRYRDRGFEVLAFPANEFGGQEPGSDQEIREFCQSRYDVTFPLFAKIVVKGALKHPLYEALTRAEGKPEISWNFEKFLVDRKGKVVARFAPAVAPEDPSLVTAVERALAD